MKAAFLFSMIIMFCSIGFSQTQNVGIGTLTPAFKLDVKNGSINTDSVYRIGAITVLSVRGTGNLFVGKDAGRINTGINNTFSGDQAGYLSTNFGSSNNSFFGQGAGYSNTDGSENSFFGQGAGHFNLDGSFNSFFGRSAGLINLSGDSDSFFGAEAGYSNVTGDLNSFFGAATGRENSSGKFNSFFGANAGRINTTGHYNSFFGQAAGYLNYTGFGNSFFGMNAGYDNFTGTRNTAVGDSANVNTGALTNATVIGAKARVDCSNCMVLGSVNNINGATSGVNVGIGVNSPNAKLSVSTNGNVLAGSATSNTLNTNAGTLSSMGDSEMSLANIGFMSGNNSSLGVRAFRTSPGSDWTSTSLLLEYDVDNSARVNGAYVALNANGNIGIGTKSPGFKLDVIGNTAITGNFLNNGTNGIAVVGTSLITPGQGLGVYGEGGSVGVEGVARLTGEGDRFGVSGHAYSGVYNFGVKGDANGGTNAYGVYGSASGGTNSYGVYGAADGPGGSTWAGYFNGDVFASKVGIGTNSPAFKLDVANGSINTDSLYRIGGTTVLAMPGYGNLFVGKNAGKVNTGDFNSFFGEQAGYSNDYTFDNSFFGVSAGYFNTSGSANSFFGQSAGGNNTTGSHNTAVGYQAYFMSGSLTNATAIGANSYVGCSNCLVLGSEDIKVGIGTTTPLAKLHISTGASGNTTPFSPLVVEGYTNTYINLLSPNANETAVLFGKADNAASGGIVYNNVNTLNGFQFRTNGNITQMKLYSDGNAWLFGALTQNSDVRLKKEIHPLMNSLQKITQLSGYHYYWKNISVSKDLQIGVLAQEVQKFFPELVKEDNEGMLSVNYSGLIPVLIESIKEQQQQIDELKKLVLELSLVVSANAQRPTDFQER